MGYDWSRPKLFNYENCVIEPVRCEYCGRWTEGTEKGCNGCGAPVDLSSQRQYRPFTSSCCSTSSRFTTWNGSFG